MDILVYSDDHIEFRKKVRTFMEKEVIPYVDQWEKDRVLPRSIWKKMGANKMLCTSISKKYGGMGGDFLHAVIVSEELAKTNHNGAGPSLHSDMVVPYIDSFASEENKEKFLPGCVSGDIITAFGLSEPDTGSDVASLSTSAVEKGDQVIINGAKIFTSNGISCDLLVLVARDPEVKSPYESMSVYLVEADTPGFKKGNKLDKMGWYSQDTAEVFFSDCCIPVKNRLGQKGQGWKLIMNKLQQERLLTALWAQVFAEHILTQTLDYYKGEGTSDTYVSNSQANQFSIVEMATDVKIGRTFVDKLIVDHMAGEDVIIETSMAKFWITEMVRRVADRCLDIYGITGMAETCPEARAWRDVRCMSIFGGTNEIQRLIIGKFMGL